MKKPPFKLAKYERVVTAWCERACGPGWANSPLWVIVVDGDGKMRQECIQPREQTAAMHYLYDVAAASHSSLMSAVHAALTVKR